MAWLIGISLLAAQGVAQPAPPAQLEVAIDNLRNERGVVRLCLTRHPQHFPDCRADPGAIKKTVPAAQAGPLLFSNIEPDVYALSFFHDENEDGELDTFMGIPTEGFGFSRNPAIRFKSPKFSQVRFEIEGMTRQTVRTQYLL